MKTSWDPIQYDKYEKERQKPFYDLLSLVIPQEGMSAVDLGCGSGKLTKILKDFLSAKKVLGVDSSSEMLKNIAYRDKDLSFTRQKIEEFSPEEKWDLIFSNAALHWVRNHKELISRLTSYLTPKGQLAIQIPDHQAYPTHLAAKETALKMPFAEYIKSDFPVHALALEEYANLLYELGFAEIIVRSQIYPLQMPSREGVLEFVKGSLLTYYKGRLPEEIYPDFLKSYTECLFTLLEDTQPYLFLTKRILIWAKK